MRPGRLRRECEALVRDLDIPRPFDVHLLCRSIAERRRRPIHLEPMRMPADGPCGVWISGAGIDYIFFEQLTSPLHQEHIIAHELGHLLCDHRTASVLSDDTSRTVMPTLDPKMVERILHRTHYNEVEEQQAEIIASLILREANRTRPQAVRSVPPEAAAIVERVERSLLHPEPGRPERERPAPPAAAAAEPDDGDPVPAAPPG